jgi:hypothetical protein
MEFDLVVAPGADPGDVRFQFSADVKPKIGKRGNLILNLPSPLWGEGAAQSGVRGSSSLLSPLRGEGAGVRGDRLKLFAPHTYQEIDGERVTVESRFIRHGNRVGFRVGSYDHAHPLIIDPELGFGTYVGGAADDEGLGIAVDDAGVSFVTGWTRSSVIGPGSGGSRLSKDVFVARLSADGDQLEYISYFGGALDDTGQSIVVDADGTAYIAGWTASTDFPTTPGVYLPNPLPGMGMHAFVTKLNLFGAIVWSTYFGRLHEGTISLQGWEIDYQVTAHAAFAVDLDEGGFVYLGGSSSGVQDAAGIGAPPPPDIAGVADAFVGSLLAEKGTFAGAKWDLGGPSGAEEVRGLVAQSSGVHVTGWTSSPDFPLAGNSQQVYAGAMDAFVARLTPSLTALTYSTYHGGPGNDVGYGIAVDASGSDYITGRKFNWFQDDAFLSKFDTQGALTYSSLFGGGSFDCGYGIAVDEHGHAYVTGETMSSDFPLVDARQLTFGGLYDAFLTEFNADGTQIMRSTYLGGMENDGGRAIALDVNRTPHVTGYTRSTDFPLLNPLQSANAGGSDAFAVKDSRLGIEILATVLDQDEPPNRTCPVFR